MSRAPRKITVDLESMVCQVCGETRPEAEVCACGECGTLHHRDCFEWMKRCSTFGCGGTRTVEVPRDTRVLLLQPRRKSGLPAAREGEHRSVSLAAPRVRFELDTPLESFLHTLTFGALMLMLGFVVSLQGAPENLGAVISFMALPFLWVFRLSRGRYPHRSNAELLLLLVYLTVATGHLHFVDRFALAKIRGGLELGALLTGVTAVLGALFRRFTDCAYFLDNDTGDIVYRRKLGNRTWTDPVANLDQVAAAAVVQGRSQNLVESIFGFPGDFAVELVLSNGETFMVSDRFKDHPDAKRVASFVTHHLEVPLLAGGPGRWLRIQRQADRLLITQVPRENPLWRFGRWLFTGNWYPEVGREHRLHAFLDGDRVVTRALGEAAGPEEIEFLPAPEDPRDAPEEAEEEPPVSPP